MTDVAPGALDDSNALAYSHRAPSAAAQARRTRRWGWWFAAEHMLLTMRRYGWPIVVSDVGQPLLYLFAMGVGLGAVVDANAGSVDGVPYLVFVAPALLVSTAVMTAGTEMTFPVMGGFKWNRTYYGMSASALQPWQIGMGHLLSSIVRFTGIGLVYWLLMLGTGATGGPASVLVIPVGVLAAVAVGAPLQAYSATLKDEGFQFSFIQRFIIMPMFLFAGTFFELGSMPVYLRWIGWLSPVWHGSELARAASYGRDLGLGMAALHLGYLALLVAIGVVLVCRNYTRRLGE